MILLLDTAAPFVKLTMIEGATNKTVEWQADRELARGLLQWLEEQLHASDMTWHDIQGIAVFRGPGSFTGLRIGLTVMNTLAESLQVPIVGGQGEQWQQIAQARLSQGENDGVVLPHYDRDATITTQRK